MASCCLALLWLQSICTIDHHESNSTTDIICAGHTRMFSDKARAVPYGNIALSDNGGVCRPVVTPVLDKRIRNHYRRSSDTHRERAFKKPSSRGDQDPMQS